MTNEQSDVREEPAAAIAGAETIQGAGERMPPVPDSIREAARLAPDHWLGMVDPAWEEDGEPPSWAVVGQWRSSPEGEIVEWRDNDEYRPSPAALGWPEPADDVDAAVQLAATGYGPGEAVTEALAAAEEVAVFVTPAGDPLAAKAPDGRTAVIPVFTSPVYLHAAGRLAFELMDLWELVDSLPEDHVLYLNPSAPVSMTVETAMLVEALEQAGADAGEAGAQEDDVEPPARPATVGITSRLQLRDLQLDPPEDPRPAPDPVAGDGPEGSDDLREPDHPDDGVIREAEPEAPSHPRRS